MTGSKSPTTVEDITNMQGPTCYFCGYERDLTEMYDADRDMDEMLVRARGEDPEEARLETVCSKCVNKAKEES